MQENIQQMAVQWIGYKARLIDYFGLTNDAMHIHGSLIILFAAAIILRRRPDSLWCWLIVLIAELFNEYADLEGNAPGEGMLEAAAHDIYTTMLWPTVLLVLGRFLFPSKPNFEPKTAESESGDLADQSFKEPAPV